jgi:hypothetical protein
MEFFTRYGTKHEGRMHDVNEAKGTAAYTYQDRCSRCGGAGASDKWINTGRVCFDCNGSGKGYIRTAKLYSAEKLAKLNAVQAIRDEKRTMKAQAAKAAQEAEADARRAEFVAANLEVVDGINRLAAVENPNPFIADMARRLREVGNLSEKQLAAAATTIARIAAQEAARAASRHVGEIGKRVVLVVKIERVIQLDSDLPKWYRYAAPSIYLGRDEQGNRIVYKGTGSFGSANETILVKATIDEHGERDGELQTVVSRPKVQGILDPETGKFMIWDDATGTLAEVAR